MKETIEQPTQEQIQRAIQTIPFPVYSISVDMYAHNLKFPDRPEDRIETYLSQCADLGILPFSEVIFDYTDSYDEDEEPQFVIRSQRLFNMGFDYSDKTFETVNQSLIRGGKPNRFLVVVKQSGRTGFQLFKEQLLETLLEEEYEFDSANVTFDLEEESPNHRSYVSINEYGRDSKEKLAIWTYNSESPENRQTFLDWFEQLQQVPV